MTVTFVNVLTVPACTETLPPEFPPGMVRLGGTGNAEPLVVARPICAPLAGAGPFNVTVTVAVDPLVIVDGLIVMLAKVEPAVVKLEIPDQLPY